MTDEEFYQKFEDTTLDAKVFNHSNHVKMAWIYLKKYEMPAALGNFSEALKRYAKAKGATNLYHETITFAFLVLINERMKAVEDLQNWEDFVANNPDLFDWKKNILKTYYKEETLKSKFAKKHFVFPDKNFRTN